jgi:hypothetical protein
MAEMITWIAAFAFVVALAVLAVWYLRGQLGAGAGAGFGGGLFGPPKERRLEVVDHANLDGRRRLVLIRRDNVEHLIMTGGPVDVVIETNIGAPKAAEARPRVAAVDGADRVVFGRAAGVRQGGQTASTAQAADG